MRSTPEALAAIKDRADRLEVEMKTAAESEDFQTAAKFKALRDELRACYHQAAAINVEMKAASGAEDYGEAARLQQVLRELLSDKSKSASEVASSSRDAAPQTPVRVVGFSQEASAARSIEGTDEMAPVEEAEEEMEDVTSEAEEEEEEMNDEQGDSNEDSAMAVESLSTQLVAHDRTVAPAATPTKSRQRKRGTAITASHSGGETALDCLFKELRPPPPAAEPAGPQMVEPGHIQYNQRGAPRATLLDILHTGGDGPGGVLFSWLPSRGDVERIRVVSWAIRAAVDGGGPVYRYTGLFRTTIGTLPRSELRTHQHGSLRHMAAAEDPPNWCFGELRGGILADDPGCGKSVTMLALIVASSGVQPQPPPEFWDPNRIREGWAHLRYNRIAKQQLTPLLNRVPVRGAHSFLLPP